MTKCARSVVQSLDRRTLLKGAGTGAGAVMATMMAATPLLAVTNGLPTMPSPQTIELHTGNGRAIPVTEWRPATPERGIVLFSHGALSAPWYYPRLLAPVIAAGWRVLAPLHVDSKEHPHTADYPGLAGWKARIEDMRALIEHIGDAPYVGMGHSYGALVATVTGGVSAVPPPGIDGPLVPRLAKAVIAFSPPPPIPVLVTEQGYATLARPALIETGTIDIPPGAAADTPEPWKGHLAPFYASSAGLDHYAMLIEGANHYFGGAICDYSQPGPLQLHQLDEANHRTALFLAAYGLDHRASLRALTHCITDNLPVRLQKR